MCIIVDANRMGAFLNEPHGKEVAPIHKWLGKQNRPGHLVYSTDGPFFREVSQRAKQKLAGYPQAGRAHMISAKYFKDLEQEIRDNSEVRSDDPHILALARYSGARILFTDDRDLVEDFKNHKLINKPRGKIYSGQHHAHLLNSSACRRT